jgi:hypothetical protein
MSPGWTKQKNGVPEGGATLGQNLMESTKESITAYPNGSLKNKGLLFPLHNKWTHSPRGPDRTALGIDNTRSKGPNNEQRYRTCAEEYTRSAM